MLNSYNEYRSKVGNRLETANTDIQNQISDVKHLRRFIQQQKEQIFKKSS